MTTQFLLTNDLSAIQNELRTKSWLVACLCAAWCDTCASYRAAFDQLRTQHQDKCFAWIDIEDHANLVEDLDIENFPTILIQYKEKILFFGTMLPDANLVHRLLQSLDQRLQESVLEDMTTSIQISNHPIPANWSMRQSLLDSSQT
jgi:thioredoxin 1